VGYCGGRQRDPTYHQLGDHTEALQIDFDPSRISYARLLELFLEGGHPFRPAYSRQYRSAIFGANAEQLAQAREALREKGRAVRRELHTRVEPLERFYLAEDYHQKYGLRHHPLLSVFEGYSPEAFVDSTVAARLNGLLAGHGTSEQLERELPSYGLPEKAGEQLRRMTGVTTAGACRIG
jgi:peptide-methionine (S)-S-oxide reductase